MKKALALLLLCTISATYSQSEYRLQSKPETWILSSPQEVRQTLIQDKKIREEQLAKLVKEKNIPYTYVTEGNVYHELVDYYPDGTPIYYQTYNSKASQTANINAIQSNWNLALTGKGITLGVFDTSVLYDKHVEFLNSSNIRLRSPSVSADATFEQKRYYLNLQEHSTHVSGTIKAEGINSFAKGLANQVNLWSYDWKNDILDMMKASEEGMLISNHSYGQTIISDAGQLLVSENYVGTYSSKAVQVDYLTNINPYYQPVVAAGNAQRLSAYIHPGTAGYSNLASMATAKNAIVVGAAADEKFNNKIQDLVIADFSSYGPTRDFRIKPDITTKGVAIYSTVTDALLTPTTIVNNARYQFDSGTSMATPVVSAVLALWQQWAIENFGKPMWSSTLRALVAHSALAPSKMRIPNTNAVVVAAEGPNAAYGWGVLDAEKGISILEQSKSGLTYIIEGKLSNKEKKAYIINTSLEDNEIEVTIAWTDPPGVFDYNKTLNGLFNKSLVNDLDLRVVVDETIYMPWALKKDIQNPIAQKSDNDVDNIEKINSVAIPVGKTTISVSHKSDLVNNVQSFSLLITSKKKTELSMITNIDEAQPTVDTPTTGTENEIKELAEKKSFIEIIPNPVKDFLNLSITDSSQQIQGIQIFSMDGQLKFSDQNYTNQPVNVKGMASGMYIVRIATNKGIVSQLYTKN